MSFNIFATATSDIPLANLDANFTMIGSSAVASTLYPTASTSITYGTAGTTHYFSGSGGQFTGTLSTTGAVNIGSYGVSAGAYTNVITLASPAASGSTRGDFSRILDVAGSRCFDAGVSSSGAWVQSRDKNDYSVNYDLTLQPNGGNLGIGTSSPGYKLDVAGTVNVVNGSNGRINIGATNNYLYGDSSGNFIVGTSGSDKLQLNSSGNLGLGVTPSAWYTGYKAFQLTGDIGFASTGGALRFNNYLNAGGSSDIYYGNGWAGRYRFTLGNHLWDTAPSGTGGDPFSFGDPKMTLDASGNLLVGQTSTGIVAGTGFSLYKTTGIFGQNHSTANVGGDYFTVFGYNGSVIGSITQSGTTAVLFNVTSDQRLKENIVDAPEFGDVIDSIQVRSYDWKTDQTHQRAGFIAQELVAVAPEAVHQPADPDDMMAVDYSKLVPMLVKEIQSLRKRITALEAK